MSLHEKFMFVFTGQSAQWTRMAKESIVEYPLLNIDINAMSYQPYKNCSYTLKAGWER